MGLGKTVQVAALLAVLLGKTGERQRDVAAQRASRSAVDAMI